MNWIGKKTGYLQKSIPAECVSDCSARGDVSEPVAYWRKRLAFVVPRDLAIAYLSGFGAWDDLDTISEDTLAERCLWIACGDIKENGEWFGLVE